MLPPALFVAAWVAGARTVVEHAEVSKKWPEVVPAKRAELVPEATSTAIAWANIASRCSLPSVRDTPQLSLPVRVEPADPPWRDPHPADNIGKGSPSLEEIQHPRCLLSFAIGSATPSLLAPRTCLPKCVADTLHLAGVEPPNAVLVVDRVQDVELHPTDGGDAPSELGGDVSSRERVVAISHGKGSFTHFSRLDAL